MKARCATTSTSSAGEQVGQSVQSAQDCRLRKDGLTPGADVGLVSAGSLGEGQVDWEGAWRWKGANIASVVGRPCQEYTEDAIDATTKAEEQPKYSTRDNNIQSSNSNCDTQVKLVGYSEIPPRVKLSLALAGKPQCNASSPRSNKNLSLASVSTPPCRTPSHPDPKQSNHYTGTEDACKERVAVDNSLCPPSQENESLPVGSGCSSTFGKNRMDQLIGTLRSDVGELRLRGDCLARQLWLLYVTFEDLLYFQHSRRVTCLSERSLSYRCRLPSPSPSATTATAGGQGGHLQCQEEELSTGAPIDLSQDERVNRVDSAEVAGMDKLVSGFSRISCIHENAKEDFCKSPGQNALADTYDIDMTSPGATSSGYDTDQDYMTWQEVRMHQGKISMAAMNDARSRKSGGRHAINRAPNQDDEYVIRADDLYHNSYTSSNSNESLSQRKVRKSSYQVVPMKRAGPNAPDQAQEEWLAARGRQSDIIVTHPGAGVGAWRGPSVEWQNLRARQPSVERTRLGNMRKTMENIICDLVQDMSVKESQGRSQSSSLSGDVQQNLMTNLPRARHCSRDTSKNELLPEAWEPDRRDRNAWEPLSRLKTTNPCQETRSCERDMASSVDSVEQLTVISSASAISAHPTSGREHTVEPSPSCTQLDRPFKASLGQREIPFCGKREQNTSEELESKDLGSKSPYNPCSSGSISSDSGMASFATGEYSVEYDYGPWSVSPPSIIPSKGPVDVDHQENIYETIPDDWGDVLQESCRRSSVDSTATTNTYATIDTSMVADCDDDPPPPALPARNYRRLGMLSYLAHPAICGSQYRKAISLAPERRGRERTPHLDDIVKASDILVDTPGNHMYTVSDVLQSFERLAGHLPEDTLGRPGGLPPAPPLLQQPTVGIASSSDDHTSHVGTVGSRHAVRALPSQVCDEPWYLTPQPWPEGETHADLTTDAMYNRENQHAIPACCRQGDDASFTGRGTYC